MKKSKHTESEMVKAIQKLESGVQADVVAREYGISRATLYNWKSKYSGMEVSQVTRLKELEEENRRLKQMYADLALDNKILRDVIEKKTIEPEVKKEITSEIIQEHSVSITRACRLMMIHRSYFYYIEKKDDYEVSVAIKDASEFGDGFWKIFARIRRSGKNWNHKSVYRVYKSMCYNKRSKLKKRLPARVNNPLVTPQRPNDTWSMDFVSDTLESGRKFRVLNILDDFDRSAVAQEIFMSMPSERVIRILEKIIWIKGKPENIRCDNGPEFISNKFQDWCKANDITIKYTQPGCPTQNSFVERFNGSYRRAILDAYIFRNLNDVRELTESWMTDYNENRPHYSLGDMSPNEYRREYEIKYVTLAV